MGDLVENRWRCEPARGFVFQSQQIDRLLIERLATGGQAAFLNAASQRRGLEFEILNRRVFFGGLDEGKRWRGGVVSPSLCKVGVNFLCNRDCWPTSPSPSAS